MKHFWHISYHHKSTGSSILFQLLPLSLLLLVLSCCETKVPIPEDLGLPQLKITLSQAALQKVKQKRAEALARGMLESSGKDYVNASITYEDNSLAAEIRLKGDWLDHLKGDKWSWRVKLDNGQAILGADQFSLQHPRTRYYLHEWVFHQLLEQEKILSPRYEFVELWLNGDYKGIYAFEAHFTEALLARQKQPAGVILKLNEDGFWETQNYRMRYGKNVTPALPDFEAATIEPFQKNRTQSDSLLSLAFQAGRERLNNLRLAQDSTLIPEIIDIDYWARTFALIDLAEAYHALRWHNMRWYYHPQTTRLYPIGFDGYAANGIYRWFRKAFIGQARPKGNQVFFAEEYMIFFLFNHPGFQERYEQYLLRYTAPDFIDRFTKKIHPEFLRLQTALKYEFPDYTYPEDALTQRAKTLRTAVLNYDFQAAPSFVYSIYDPMFADCDIKVPLADIAVKAFRSANGKELLLQNYYCGDIQIEATGPSRNKPLHELKQEVILPTFDIHTVPPQTLFLEAPEADAYVFYSIKGIDYWFRQKIDPWLKQETDFISPFHLQIDSSLFRIDGKQVIPLEPELVLRDIQVIPTGYTLAIPKGTRIYLNAEASLFIYGNAQLSGTAKDPIQITSSDGSGRGIHFLQADTVSISHTQLSFNKTFRDRGLQLNGAMTCQAKVLNLQHLLFEHIDTEDALNVIQCPQAQLSNLTFRYCNGDGLDVDFSQGVLTAGTFNSIGGDAIDISGSTFRLSELAIEQIIDKGISVGEEATVVIERADITKAFIGLAVKDGSEVALTSSQLAFCDFGLAVFTKKNNFGAGGLSVLDCTFGRQVQHPYAVELPHRLVIDGQLQQATDGAGTLAPLFYPSTN